MICAVVITLIEEHVYRDGYVLRWITRTHASPVDFNLFPFIVFTRWSDGLALAIPVIAVSPVLLTAYWMTAQTDETLAPVAQSPVRSSDSSSTS